MTEYRSPLHNKQTFDAVKIITNGEYVGDFGCDEIEIVTVPRMRDSDVYVNEWRISTEITFLSRGRVVKVETGGTVAKTCDKLLFLIKKHFRFSTPQQTRAKAILFYKGVGRYSFNADTIEDAALMLPHELDSARYEVVWSVNPPTDYCDQEGCSNKWTKEFKIKKNLCWQCSKEYEIHLGGIRKFCSEHCRRGEGTKDEDSAANYTDVTRVQTRSQTQAEPGQQTKKRKMK